MRKYTLLLRGLACSLALLLAYALQGRTLTTCYAVCGEDANYYYVCGSVTGKTHGIDYICNSHPTATCVICTDDAPDALGRVRKSNSVVYLYGQYISLEQPK